MVCFFNPDQFSEDLFTFTEEILGVQKTFQIYFKDR